MTNYTVNIGHHNLSGRHFIGVPVIVFFNFFGIKHNINKVYYNIKIFTFYNIINKWSLIIINKIIMIN